LLQGLGDVFQLLPAGSDAAVYLGYYLGIGVLTKGWLIRAGQQLVELAALAIPGLPEHITSGGEIHMLGHFSSDPKTMLR
jgi:hypothetical protein